MIGFLAKFRGPPLLQALLTLSKGQISATESLVARVLCKLLFPKCLYLSNAIETELPLGICLRRSGF